MHTIAFLSAILALLIFSTHCQTSEVPDPKPGWVNYATYDFSDSKIPSIFRAYGDGYQDTYGEASNQLEAEVPSQVKVVNGTLQLWADRRLIHTSSGKIRHFAGSFLGTRDTGHYFPAFARFEFHARFDQAQGLWPAIWLRHRKGAPTCEVDIFEEFHSQVGPGGTSALHIDGNPQVLKAFRHDASWHTHAVEITQLANNNVNFTFFVDDAVTLTHLDASHKWVSKAPLNATWDIALNFAVGGKWTGDPDEPHLGQLHTNGTVEFDPVNITHRIYHLNRPSDNKCAHGGTFPNCNTNGIVRATFPHKAEFSWFRVLVRDNDSAHTVCSSVIEHRNSTMSCSSGKVISVTSAFYGTPSLCPSPSAGTCNSPNAASIVESLCNGKTVCSIYVSNAVFGDPCRGTVKSLISAYVCK